MASRATRLNPGPLGAEDPVLIAIIFYVAATAALAFGAASFVIASQVPKHRIPGTSGWKYLVRSIEVENSAGKRLRRVSKRLWWAMIVCVVAAIVTRMAGA